MNQINLTILSAKDGGVVVYESLDETEQTLVFAGNVKESSEYLAKRVGMLGTVEVKTLPDRYAAARQYRIPTADNIALLDLDS